MTTKPLFHSAYKINTIATVFFACFMVCQFVIAAGPQISWEADFDQAAMQSKASNRPLFIHFYGDNCPPCKSMENTVFTNPQVVAQMNRDFVALRINIADQPLLAKRFTIKAIPTDVVLMPDGQLVHRRQGGIATDRFAEYLVYLLNTVQKEAVKQQQLVIQNPPAVQIQQQAQPEPLRDPFTKQPVTQSTPMTPPERYNPARDERLTGNEFSSAQLVSQVVPPTVSPLSLREPAVVPPSLPVGPPSNTDEIATTMVEVPLGLEGYCPVMLSTEERWIPGNPAYYTMYRGHVFRFSSEETMMEFMKEPAKYAPVVMGEDIVQMVDRNKKIYGNRKFGAWFQGRVFLFCNQESLDAFGARPEYYAEIALKYEMAFKGPLGRF